MRSRPRGHRSLSEPVRTCIGCRRKASQRELVRLVVDGRQLVWGAGRAGRGAWLCRDRIVECFDAAVARRRWSRALRVDIDPESIASLRRELSRPG